MGSVKEFEDGTWGRVRRGKVRRRLKTERVYRGNRNYARTFLVSGRSISDPVKFVLCFFDKSIFR